MRINPIKNDNTLPKKSIREKEKDKEKEEHFIEVKKFIENYNKYERVISKKLPVKRSTIKKNILNLLVNMDEIKNILPDVGTKKKPLMRKSSIRKDLSAGQISTTQFTNSLMLKSLKNTTTNNNLNTWLAAGGTLSNRESITTQEDIKPKIRKGRT